MNKQLTIDELRAYQAGQLDGPARHRVERLLLEDPFYADALEGLEALQRAGASLPKQTAQLRRALNDRISESATERRLFPLWVTTMAASIVLVMGVALYFIFTKQASKPPVAQQTRTVGPEKLTDEEGLPVEIGTGDSAVHKTVETVGIIERHLAKQPARPVTVPSHSEGQPTESVAVVPRRVSQLPVRTTVIPAELPEPDESLAGPALPDENDQRTDYQRIVHPERAFGPNAPAAPEITLWSDKQVNSILAQQISSVADAVPVNAGRATASSVAFRKQNTVHPLPSSIVQGLIVDQQGHPLQGVSVAVKGLGRGTTTDAQGRFLLDSALVTNKQLIASFVGFQTQEFPPAALAKGAVQLNEDARTLNEVVTVGYGAKAAQTAALPVATSKDFTDFVRNNSQNGLITQSMPVSFQTDKDGKAQRIRVQNSPNPSAETEAIRLIKAYTGWPRNQSVSVTITP